MLKFIAFILFVVVSAFAAVMLLAVLACAVHGEVVTQPGTIVVAIPREEVIRESGLMVAKEVVGAVTIKINGKTYTGTLNFPDTKVRRVGVGHMRVDACTANGEIR